MPFHFFKANKEDFLTDKSKAEIAEKSEAFSKKEYENNILKKFELSTKADMETQPGSGNDTVTNHMVYTKMINRRRKLRHSIKNIKKEAQSGSENNAFNNVIMIFTRRKNLRRNAGCCFPK